MPNLDESELPLYSEKTVVPIPSKEHYLEVNAEWQTRARGSDANEYDIYLACADDGTGHEIGTGRPLKTFDEWLAS